MESNRIIADFIGAVQTYKPYVNTDDMEYDMYGVIPTIEDGENEKHYFLPQEMLFDSDWNWLMEVVNRIKQVGKEELKFSVEFQLAILTTNKETIYNECLEFIKWYNEQK
jgi:hypothetical protein